MFNTGTMKFLLSRLKLKKKDFRLKEAYSVYILGSKTPILYIIKCASLRSYWFFFETTWSKVLAFIVFNFHFYGRIIEKPDWLEYQNSVLQVILIILIKMFPISQVMLLVVFY
jgi:hypothetical protein